MKKLPLFLLALSLVANVALLLRKPPPADRTPRLPSGQAITSTASSPSKVAHADTGLSAEDEASLQHARQLLATDDLPALVARLRAAGFSSMDIRGIVSARLAERYGAARVAATAHLEVVPYWRSNSSFPRDPATGAEVRRLFSEQNRKLKELLGPDARATDEWSQMLHDRQWGYLPDEKVERLTAILDDYNDLKRSVWDDARGMITSAEQEKIAMIEKEQRADLEAVLTPEELEAYEMHTSGLSHQLRRMMTAFQPTEAEYQALYRMVLANSNNGTEPIKLNQQFIASGPSAGQPTDITDQLATVLSPDRAAEFRMVTSNEYLQLARLANRFDIPESAIKATYTLAQSTQQRASAIMTDPTLADADRKARLTALGQEAATQVQAQLGYDAYQTYLTQGGQWLTSIQRGIATPQPPRGPIIVPAVQLP